MPIQVFYPFLIGLFIEVLLSYVINLCLGGINLL